MAGPLKIDDPDTITTAWSDAVQGILDPLPAREIREATRALTDHMARALADGDESSEPYRELRYLVEDFTRSWRETGVDARQMSRFFRQLGRILQRDPDGGTLDPDAFDEVNDFVDTLLLWSLEARLSRLTDIVEAQREEMEELSTPFIEIYEGLAVLPLVGTLDSQRAESVMESLLEGIAANRTRLVVLDITGVPAVDAFVAERIVKTVEAARLMGTQCILSGLGPRIALTMVRLGVDLELVESTAKLSQALERAFKRMGLRIVPRDATVDGS